MISTGVVAVCSRGHYAILFGVSFSELRRAWVVPKKTRNAISNSANKRHEKQARTLILRVYAKILPVYAKTDDTTHAGVRHVPRKQTSREL